MSKIITRSVFYYNTGIRIENRYIDFNEGGPTLFAQMNIGDYTLTEFVAELGRAINLAGGQIYNVTLNRNTSKITISAPSNFTLLCGTGPRSGQAVWTTAGFTATDKTGTNTYTSENGAGNEYQTQYPVSQYESGDHSVVLESAAYNVTPIGTAQIASFGDGLRMQLNIRVITEMLNLKNDNFYENANGITEFMTFINRIMRRDRVEFMPDVSDRNSFLNLLLESTQDDGKGLEFVLKNMETPNFYESGRLTFRKLLL